MMAKEKRLKLLRARIKVRDKGQDKKKNSSDPTEKALDTVAPQLGQTVEPVVSKTKA